MAARFARSALVATLAALSLGAPLGLAGSSQAMPRLVFPVVGTVTYTNDFGAPRGQGAHEGNDIMATKKSLAVAVEAGTVKFWTSSANAGCMLYLDGDSGTQYLYIHLNNDRTMRNDNSGKCVPGTAYAKGLSSGARVQAGQPIGYVGDSGDANGIASHLHFELHPDGGCAVSPYRYLKSARKLLFAARPGAKVSLRLRGTLVAADSAAGTLTLQVTDLRASTGLRLKKISRSVVLALTEESSYVDSEGNILEASNLDSLSAKATIEIDTVPAEVTLDAELGKASALAVSAARLYS